MCLCFLFLAGTGSGIAEIQQEKPIQLNCWLNSESLFSSNFSLAFQILVPKNPDAYRIICEGELSLVLSHYEGWYIVWEK